MSTKSSSSDPSENPSENSGSLSQFSTPRCTMCTKKEISKSCCLTCHRYLCERCDFAHQLMVCFKTHRLVSLSDVKDIEQLEKVCSETSSSNEQSPTYDEKVNMKAKMKALFLKGTDSFERLMKLSHNLKNNQDDIERECLKTIEYVNNLYKDMQDQLRQKRDEIVTSLQTNFNERSVQLSTCKDGVDAAINDLYMKLSNIKLIIEENEVDSTSACDLPSLIKNGYTDDFLNYNFYTPPLSQDGSVDNGASNSLSSSSLQLHFNYDNTFGTCNGEGNSRNYVDPNELLNLPVVLSDPSESKSSVNLDLSLTSAPDSPPRKKSNPKSMQLYKTFGQRGTGSGQFNSPHGVCLGCDEDIIVADSSNHRIQIFDKLGNFKRQFGTAGRHDGHLWHPRKVAWLPIRRRFVVCDRGYDRSRMQIFSEEGKYVRKIFVQFIDILAGITVTENEEIVVIDSVTPTVFVIGPNEYLKSIDCTKFVIEPSDIAVIGKEFYICDFKGHKIVAVDEDGNLLRTFGTRQEVSFPNGIAVSATGDVLVGDSHGNFFHIAVFSKYGDLIADFRCPYVKVSRCCGLNITSQGCLITVDKNYHHVIILDTLYVAPDTD